MDISFVTCFVKTVTRDSMSKSVFSSLRFDRKDEKKVVVCMWSFKYTYLVILSVILLSYLCKKCGISDFVREKGEQREEGKCALVWWVTRW